MDGSFVGDGSCSGVAVGCGVLAGRGVSVGTGVLVAVGVSVASGDAVTVGAGVSVAVSPRRRCGLHLHRLGATPMFGMIRSTGSACMPSTRQQLQRWGADLARSNRWVFARLIVISEMAAGQGQQHSVIRRAIRPSSYDISITGCVQPVQATPADPGLTSYLPFSCYLPPALRSRVSKTYKAGRESLQWKQRAVDFPAGITAVDDNHGNRIGCCRGTVPPYPQSPSGKRNLCLFFILL
jgi:hypothetical protein